MKVKIIKDLFFNGRKYNKDEIIEINEEQYKQLNKLKCISLIEGKIETNNIKAKKLKKLLEGK